MIDLSPPELQRQVLKERFRRLGLVFALCLAVIFLFTWILLSPSFFLLVFEQKEFTRQRIILEETLGLQRSKEIDQELSLLDSKARGIIENEKHIQTVSASLAQVFRSVDPNVSFKVLSVRKVDAAGTAYSIDISGNAVTRDDFISFVVFLRSKPGFSVESPLANVLKERDADFRLNILVKRLDE